MPPGALTRQLDTTALPVGHGLAMRLAPRGSLTLGNHTWWFKSDAIFDFGGLSSGIKKAIAGMPKKLSLLALSHFDADHISGVPQLLHHSSIDHLWIPGHGVELRFALAVDAAFRMQAQGFTEQEI